MHHAPCTTTLCETAPLSWCSPHITVSSHCALLVGYARVFHRTAAYSLSFKVVHLYIVLYRYYTPLHIHTVRPCLRIRAMIERLIKQMSQTSEYDYLFKVCLATQIE